MLRDSTKKVLPLISFIAIFNNIRFLSANYMILLFMNVKILTYKIELKKQKGTVIIIYSIWYVLYILTE